MNFYIIENEKEKAIINMEILYMNYLIGMIK